MGETPRPILENDQDQDAQAEQLHRTGDGISVDNEEALLRAEFGDPNEEGIYGRPVEE